jgi:hypothetical protein
MISCIFPKNIYFLKKLRNLRKLLKKTKENGGSLNPLRVVEEMVFFFIEDFQPYNKIIRIL